MRADEHNGTEENSIREVGLACRKTFEIEKHIREEGVQILILDNLEEQISEERILVKLQKHYYLAREKAKK